MTATTEERDVQKNYWLEHSAQPTIEAMMLDSKAAEIDQHERPEVLATLGCVAGKRVLELGAGIGRFTGELAQTAASVHACDFMQVSIDENRRQHERLGNVTFQVADVTELQLPPGSFDVLFSNWLLMYLSDEEVQALACKALSWLAEGGTLFFRESCFRQSGDRARKANPTHYRNPREYFRIFDEAEQQLPGGLVAHLELVNCKCVDTYVTLKRNQNQICWKWKKATSSVPRQPLYRQFLDGQQYSARSIQRYEAVFGPGFISVGGSAMTQQLLDLLGLQPGERLLDVGCGIGGGAFLASALHDVHVHALDLSVNCILAALERAAAFPGPSPAGAAIGTTNGTTHAATNGAAANCAASGTANGTATNGADGAANLELHAQPANGAEAAASGSERAPSPGGSSGGGSGSAGRANNVTLEVADALTREFAAGAFDAVISRDSLLHIYDKPALFGRLRTWLRPGGRLLISDYCRGPEAPSGPFAAYIKSHCYQLLTQHEYVALLTAAGFEDVVTEDRTQQFQECLAAELAALEAGQAAFVARFSEEEYEQLASSWRDKLARASAGDQCWAVFTARAPAQ